jgi:hypothetical protein
MLRSEVRNMLVLHVVFVKHHTTIVQVAFGLPVTHTLLSQWSIYPREPELV